MNQFRKHTFNSHILKPWLLALAISAALIFAILPLSAYSQTCSNVFLNKTILSTPTTATGISSLENSGLIARGLHRLNWFLNGDGSPTPRTQLQADQVFQSLLSAARGIEIHAPEEIYGANIAIKALTKMFGSFPPRFRSIDARTNNLSMLLHEPIASIEPLGGGYNTTYLVHFENGRKAVFKPFLGQKNMGPNRSEWSNNVAFVRETTAVSIIEEVLGNRQAREKGLSRIIVPETVEVSLKHKGKAYGLGSIQIFIEGFETGGDIILRSEIEWRALTQTKQWQEFEIRARVLDYIIGNPDRFTYAGFSVPNLAAANFNNVMLPKNLTSPKNFKAVLIDNAFGRPGLAEFKAHYLPPAKLIPADLVDAILAFDIAKFRQQFNGQLTAAGIDDVVFRILQLQTLIITAR